jgi:hypothetical protein
MKKNLLGIFMLVAMVFSACAGPKKAASKLDVSYMKMWRTSCFGKCPSYSVEVYKNGLVRYTGRLFVPDSGIYEKNIGTAKAQELLNRFNEYRVDTLKASYDLQIADLPGINYTFKYDKTTKQVNNGHFGPLFLRSLASEVDEVIGRMNNNEAPKLGVGWKKMNTAAK